MAGNMYVGVVGESARIREVCQYVIPDLTCQLSNPQQHKRADHKIVA